MPFIKASLLQLILITFFSGFPSTLCRICIQCFMLLEMVMKRRLLLLLRRRLANYLRKAAGLAWPRTKAASQRRGQVVPLVLRPQPASHSRSPRAATRTRLGKYTHATATSQAASPSGSPSVQRPPGAEGSAVHVGHGVRWQVLPCHTLLPSPHAPPNLIS